MSASLEIREVVDADVPEITALWERAGLTRPWNDPFRDIAFARASPNAAVLAGRAGGPIVAACMVGHDGHRGTVYYVAVDPDARGRGFGRALMVAAEDWLRAQGVWKLNLLVRADNEAVVGFYESQGYAAEERRVLSKRLDADADPSRTAARRGASRSTGEKSS